MDSAKSVAQISKKVTSDKATSSDKPSEVQVTTNPSSNLNLTVDAVTGGGSSSSIKENRVQKFQRLYKELLIKQKLQPKKKKVGTKKSKVDRVELNRAIMETVAKEAGDLAASGDTAPDLSSTEAADKSSDTGKTEANVDDVIKEFLCTISEEEVTEVTPPSETPRSPDMNLAMVVYTGPVHSPVVDVSASEPIITPVVEETVHEKEPDVETILESINVEKEPDVESIEVMQTEKVSEHSGVEKILEQEIVGDTVKDKADTGGAEILEQANVGDISQTEKTTEDTEFIEILEQADVVAYETLQTEKKRKLKHTTPTRRSTRQKDTDSDPEMLLAVEPSPKKMKLDSQKPTVSKKALKTKSSKVGGAVTGVTVKGVWFQSKLASERWSMIQKRKIVAEGLFQESKWFVPEVVRRLEDAGLMRAMKATGPFCEKLVREFIVNLSEEFGDILEEGYDKVSIRGKSVSITPEAINEFLGISISAVKPTVTNWNQVANIMTNGKITKWKGLTLESKNLTTLFALLHGICMRNWIPVTHRTTISKPMAALIYTISQGTPVDLGTIIFDQLANHALSKSPIHPIGHPSVIYQMILKQAPELQDVSAILTNPRPLIADWKLFTFKHHVDVTVPETILQALQRQGKLSEMVTGKVKEDKKADMTVLNRLKEHLKLLDRARNETMELITSLEQDESQEGDGDNLEDPDAADSEADD